MRDSRTTEKGEFGPGVEKIWPGASNRRGRRARLGSQKSEIATFRSPKTESTFSNQLSELSRESVVSCCGLFGEEDVPVQITCQTTLESEK